MNTIKVRFPTEDEISLARALRDWRKLVLARYGAKAYSDALVRHESALGFRWRSL